MIEIDNIGVLTIEDTGALYRVTGIVPGLIYCIPLNGGPIRIVLPDQFWPLIDCMP